MKRIMSVDDWKIELAKGGGPPDDVVVCMDCVDTEMKVTAAERQVRMTISTAGVDRDNDTIALKGWDLTNYKKNPVVLWAHDYRSLPIGTAVKLERKDGKLTAVDQFVERDVYPFADTVFQLLKGGYLSASSVGFKPKKHAFDEDRGGIDFYEQELLEHSIVPVPSNPEALVEARSALGDDIMQPMLKWAERMLDEWNDEPGMWMPKSKVEGVFERLKDNKTWSLPTASNGSEGASIEQTFERVVEANKRAIQLLEEWKEEDAELINDDDPGFDLNNWFSSQAAEYNKDKPPALLDIDADTMREVLTPMLREQIDDALKMQVTAITGRLVD